MAFPPFIAPAPLYRAISLGIVIGGKVRASRVTPSIGAAKRRLKTFTPDEFFCFLSFLFFWSDFS